MNENLPAPLVPPEVDLRDFAYMPLDVRRLLTSETWIDASEAPGLGHALICLWSESWHQVPAASLPDNDRVLARLAMCDKSKWAKLKPKALKGWIKCSDGLLYHPVVAEKAMSAWDGKRKQKDRTKAATEARQRQRLEQQTSTSQQHDVDRDDVRDVERDVHQGRGRGKEKGEGETQQPANGYAFEGKILRLNQRDFDQWAKAFDTFPDLYAELTVIDGKFAASPPSNAFVVASQWLRKEHERRVAAGADRRGDAPPHAQDTESNEAPQWRARIKGFIGGKHWLTEQWGPSPLSPECLCPAAVLGEFKNELNASAAA